MRSTQLAGLLLWRAGLLLAGSYSFFRIARWALRHIDIAPELELGIGLALTGAALVFVSFVLERRQDARAEGDLTE